MTSPTGVDVGRRPHVDALWYTRCPMATASSLAIQNGWMDEEFNPDGIRVASLRESAEREVLESHFDHTRANSFREGGNIPPIWVRARGGDTRLIGLSWVDEFQAILALPASGIRTVRDLRGRRLALPRRVNDKIDFWRAKTLRGFLNALALEGMTEKDVELVDLPVTQTYLDDAAAPPSATTRSVRRATDATSHRDTIWTGPTRQRLQRAEIFGLIRGEVDAIYTCGALGAALVPFLEARPVIELSRHPDRSARINNATPVALTVSGSLIRERPDLAARYAERTLAGARWGATHRSETVRAMAREIGAAEEWVEAAYEDDFNTRLQPDLSDELISAIESMKNFLLRWHFIEHDFDVHAWVDTLPLEQACARGSRSP